MQEGRENVGHAKQKVEGGLEDAQDSAKVGWERLGEKHRLAMFAKGWDAGQTAGGGLEGGI